MRLTFESFLEETRSIRCIEPVSSDMLTKAIDALRALSFGEVAELRLKIMVWVRDNGVAMPSTHLRIVSANEDRTPLASTILMLRIGDWLHRIYFEHAPRLAKECGELRISDESITAFYQDAVLYMLARMDERPGDDASAAPEVWALCSEAWELAGAMKLLGSTLWNIQDALGNQGVSVALSTESEPGPVPDVLSMPRQAWLPPVPITPATPEKGSA